MTTLIVAEHNHIALKPATLQTITAAQKLGQACHVLVMGFNAKAAAVDAARYQGVEKVILMEHKAYENATAEVLTEGIMALKEEYTAFVAPATTFGKNVMPRVAALLGVMQLSDVIDILTPDTFVRPIYAGNILLTLKSTDDIKVVTVRATAFQPAGVAQSAADSVEKKITLHKEHHCTFVSNQENVSSRPDLTSAHTVVSGGRGLQSAENFKLIEHLADALNGAIGASRAAVDAGYVPNDCQVGQTGKIVAPNLYIAVGISGAIQHLAGMKESKIIVAINKDEDAPIFQMADFGLVGDLFDILPNLTNEILKLKQI